MTWDYVSYMAQVDFSCFLTLDCLKVLCGMALLWAPKKLTNPGLIPIGSKESQPVHVTGASKDEIQT